MGERMPLTAEERREVQEIIEESFKAKDIDLSLMQQQWKKFKETPEARLASLEVKVEDLIIEFREFKKDRKERDDKREQEMKRGFEDVNKRFDDMNNDVNRRFDDVNKSINDLYKALNAQVWKFIGSLGFILILLKLAGALFP